MLQLQKIIDINQNIKQLEQQRKQVIADMSAEIISTICRNMDWNKADIHGNINYGQLEKKIMVEIRRDEEKNVRYVFSIGKSGVPNLEFREDFNLEQW